MSMFASDPFIASVSQSGISKVKAYDPLNLHTGKLLMSTKTFSYQDFNNPLNFESFFVLLFDIRMENNFGFTYTVVGTTTILAVLPIIHISK